MEIYIINLIPGDYLWTNNGTHLCDCDGLVCVVKENITLKICDDIIYKHVKETLTNERYNRGLDSDGNQIPSPEETKNQDEEQKNDTINNLINEIANLKSIINDVQIKINSKSDHYNNEETESKPSDESV